MTTDATGLSEEDLTAFMRLHTCSNPNDLMAAIERLVCNYADLAERLKRVEIENKRLKLLHGEGVQNELDVIAERDHLTAEKARLRTALEKYGHHLNDCGSEYNDDTHKWEPIDKCWCGYKAALTDLPTPKRGGYAAEENT